MLKQLNAFLFKDYSSVFVLYGVVVVAVCLQSLLLPDRQMGLDGPWYTQYNNYIIFKQSFFHLIHQQDLYAWYLPEQWDLFKYSPAFALFFGALAWLPDFIGLTLWNLLNASTVFFAIRQLPALAVKAKISILLLVLIELTTSMQNAQSNALMAGLLVLAFVRLEKGNYFLAALFITLTAFIKIFGLFAFVLYLFYPGKVRLAVYTIFCFVLLTIIPLVVVPIDQLKFLYMSWFHLLVDDHSASYGLSVMGWLASWFHLGINKNLVVGLGLLVVMLPFLRWRKYNEYSFRLLMLSSILVWIVIFNHKAESPTFIIAMTGAGIWYFLNKRNATDLVLIVSAFIFTSLSPTDVFPLWIQDNLLDPYAIKVVPCILIWCKIIFESLTQKAEIQL